WRVLGPLAPAAHNLAGRLAMSALFGPVQRQAERMFAHLGEPAPRTFFLDWPRAGAGILQLSVPSFEPVEGLPVPVHHVGSLAGPPGRPAGDPPAWWPSVQQAVADGVPVVHVTQGTAANTDLGQLVAPTIRALADLDAPRPGLSTSGPGPGRRPRGRTRSRRRGRRGRETPPTSAGAALSRRGRAVDGTHIHLQAAAATPSLVSCRPLSPAPCRSPTPCSSPSSSCARMTRAPGRSRRTAGSASRPPGAPGSLSARQMRRCSPTFADS